MVHLLPLEIPGMSKILLVDDEPAFLRLAAAWLERQGHTVATAADGAQARDLFQQAHPDLVLLDLVMPPERTPEAGLALVPIFATVPVVVLTAHAEHELALRAVAAGAWDFLAKPVEPDLLRFVVSRALTKRALEQEVATLRATRVPDDGIIGASPAIQRLKDMIRRIGPAEVPVMVLGPSGSGKELVARALHTAGPRHAGPFVAVHCGAIPAELLESELFGHLKGSFTGAHQDRQGLVAAAHGGTLFLDEVGEMPPAMQVKLLRFLQEGTYTPVGGRQVLTADVRVVSATHRDLETMVAQGAFREDFYYRLKGLILRTPALAERRGDVALLATRFLVDASRHCPLRLTPDALAWLAAQDWPGNVRELRAVVTSGAALAEGNAVTPADLAFARSGDPAALAPIPPATLAEAVAELEHRMITATLAATGNNHSAAARKLGLSRVGLLKMMNRLGLRRSNL
ncbi:sigma-54-dependent transcriptional regulator [Azospirillum palustre]